MPSATIIDEDSPAVQYTSGWVFDDSAAASGAENNTRHGTNVPGAAAVLRFPGSGIIVFGILAPSDCGDPPTTMFALDGGHASNYTAPARSAAEGMLYGVELYSIQNLTLGNHELTVTNVNGTGKIVVWLDYFHLVEPGAMPSGVGLAPVSMSSSSLSSASATPTSTETSSGTTRDGRHLRTTAIAAGTVGGVLFVAILFLVFIYIRRLHQTQRSVRPIASTSSKTTSMEGAPVLHIRPPSVGCLTLHTSNRADLKSSPNQEERASAGTRQDPLPAPPSPSALQAQVSQVLTDASPEIRSSVIDTIRAYFGGRALASEVDYAPRGRSLISEGSLPPPYMA